MTGPAREPKRCNVVGYLIEQEIACRQMERVAHPETKDGQEWGRIARVLYELRLEHCEQCGKCE